MVLVWLSAVGLSWFGDYAWNVALAWTAAHTLSPVLAGVVLGAEMLPQALLVLLGGVLADRYDPRRLLVAGQLGQAAVLVLGAAGWASGIRGAPILLAIAISFGVASGLTMPSGMTLVRQIVAGDDLGTVQGWNQISSRAMKLLGAPVGGVLVAWGGPVAVMLVDAGDLRGDRRGARCSSYARATGCPGPPTTGGATRSPTGSSYLRSHETAKLFVVGPDRAQRLRHAGHRARGRAAGQRLGLGRPLARHRRCLPRGRRDRRQRRRHPLAADVRRGRRLPDAGRPGPGDRRRRARLAADRSWSRWPCSASPPARRRSG